MWHAANKGNLGMSQTGGITRLNGVVKVSPNILTLTEGPSSGQTVGDSKVGELRASS